MKNGLNDWRIIGNLGGDPELRYTPSSVPVCNFSVAVNSSWKDRDGEVQEHTEWVHVVAWKKLAEIISQYLKKGAVVYLQGRAQTTSWEDKNTGEKKYKTELVAERMIMLGGKNGSAPPEQPPSEAVDTRERSAKQADDDLPF